LAMQRITIAKVGGVGANVVLRCLREWSAARQTASRSEWSSEQWPADVRRRADSFAEELRAHALAPPVIHFIEWADLWSMGNTFQRWLIPTDEPLPLAVYADRFTVYGYGLPDGGRLAGRLASAGPQQFVESDWFVRRLREAVDAGHELVDQAVLVVLRHVVGGLVTDDEVRASLSLVPEWLSEMKASSD
jgi:hypothetical protein